MGAVYSEQNSNLYWEHLLPLLDDAMARLRHTDQDAVVLRFFENKSEREVGRIMGWQERTVQKRLLRSVEKLQRYFLERGVESTPETMTQLISVNAVQTAPSALAKTISNRAMGCGATLGSSIAAGGGGAAVEHLTFAEKMLKIVAWRRAKIVLWAATSLILTTSVVLALNGVIAREDQAIWTTNRLDLVPPMLIIRPTKLNSGRDYCRFGERFRGKREPITGLLAAAYEFSPQRMILPSTLPPGRYDFIATVPNAKSALQNEIQKKFNLVGHSETRTVECLLLRVHSPKALGLKPAANSEKVSGNLLDNEAEMLSCSLENWARELEDILPFPVINDTNLDGLFDIRFKWDPKDKAVGAINLALRNQLGLELVPSREVINLLVVEKSK